MARPATAKSVNNKVFTSRLQRAARQFSDSVQCSGPGLSTSAVQAQSYGSTFVRYRHYGKGNDESTTYSIAIGKRKSSTLDSTQEKVAVIFSRGEVGKHYKFEFFCRHFSCVGSETGRVLHAVPADEQLAALRLTTDYWATTQHQTGSQCIDGSYTCSQCTD